MAYSIDLRSKHDARARELGFTDRHEMRAAINAIANSMSEEQYLALSDEDMEKALREYARN